MLRASLLGLPSPQVATQVFTRRWSVHGATQLDKSRRIDYTRRRRQSILPDAQPVEFPVLSQDTAQNDDAQTTSGDTRPAVFSFPKVTSSVRVSGRGLLSKGFSPPPPAQLVGPVKSNPNTRDTRPVQGTRPRKHIVPSPINAPTLPVGMAWKQSSPKALRLSRRDTSSTRTSKSRSPLYQGVDGFRTQRRKLLRVLASTSSASDGWQAYSVLLTHPLPEDQEVNGDNIPLAHLHRLFRLLAKERPKTRTIFIRLLSVLTSILNSNGIIHRHEWNSLIDCAGRGWRRTGMGDYRTAYNIFRDMTEGKPPGTSSANDVPSYASSLDEQPRSPPVEPDIHTYSTLVSIAARTLDGASVRHALSLLHASGVQPNRLTHLSLLQYFSSTDQMAAVRSTLSKMRQQNQELGLDGLNACIWAYGRHGDLRVVRRIYRILRYNRYPHSDNAEQIALVTRELLEEEGIVIRQGCLPNQATFTSMIQLMAYHGDFVATVSTFADMLGTRNWELRAPFFRVKGRRQLTRYSPTLGIFRAVFLGFSKHAIPPPSDSQPSTSSPSGSENQATWSLENLQALFDLFCDRITERPSRSTIQWIMVAFDKASGHDIALLRKVWKDLERTFDGPFAGPTNRLSKWQKMLFPEEDDGGKTR